MSIFFTSDLHIFHRNIITFCNRPFSSVEEMNEKLIDNWNSVVKHGDIIYNLGDFSFGDQKETESVLSKLNGQHHLIIGNHDQLIVKNKSHFLKWFASIESYKEIKWNKQLICLFHYGQRVWNKSHFNSFHLYGHSHSKLEPFNTSVDVGVDSTWITGKAEYRPFSFDEIFEFMKKQPKINIKNDNSDI